MNFSLNPRRRLRTGLYEIDLDAGLVLRHGHRLPLQEQPFRVLAMLIEQPGEVVSREDIQARLWPADTHVGFDEGLNTAIRKLRIAFQDSAENPRFIQTIPRRGYRFIAPVVEMHAEVIAMPEAVAAAPDAPETGAKEQPDISVATPTPAKDRRGFDWKWWLVASAVLVLMAAGTVYRLRQVARQGSTTPGRVMLAILPFQNLSGDPAQDYISDGLTEETITDVGQLSPEHLGVIARTSAMAYKHTDKSTLQIGKELGVAYILEGSVRRDSGKVRVSAQLIRVSDQTHLWAQNYDSPMQDLIEVQNKIGLAITDSIKANLTPKRQIEVSQSRSVDPGAYDLYLQGRFYWNQRTPAAMKKSIDLLQQATARDPNFALAWSGLADGYNISNILGLHSPKDSFPQARAAALRAIALDPHLAEPHAALGMEMSHYEFDLPGARIEFLRALELNPNSAYAHLFYSNCYLMPMGRRAEAIAENKKALELDPLSLPINNFLGQSYLFAGDYAQSYQQFQRTIAMDPNFALAHDYLSNLLLMSGRYPEAIDEVEKSQLLSGASPEEARALKAQSLDAFKKGGEKAFWKRQLAFDVRIMTAPGAYFSPVSLAGDYTMAGDKDKAFELLEKAFEAREGQELMLLNVDPLWKSLHGDARFTSLLRRLGLPEQE